MAKMTQNKLQDFKCINCHACCRQSGYVRLKPGEVEKISRFLGIDVLSFTDAYTVLTTDRKSLSLKEKKNGECIFLNERGCAINHVKPGQCLDFPLKWRFSGFNDICGWARMQKNHNPSMDNPSSSSK